MKAVTGSLRFGRKQQGITSLHNQISQMSCLQLSGCFPYRSFSSPFNMVFIRVTNDPHIAGTISHFSVSSGSKQDGKQTF